MPRDAAAMVERRTCRAPPGYRRSHHPITYSYAGGGAQPGGGAHYRAPSARPVVPEWWSPWDDVHDALPASW